MPSREASISSRAGTSSAVRLSNDQAYRREARQERGELSVLVPADAWLALSKGVIDQNGHSVASEMGIELLLNDLDLRVLHPVTWRMHNRRMRSGGDGQVEVGRNREPGGCFIHQLLDREVAPIDRADRPLSVFSRQPVDAERVAQPDANLVVRAPLGSAFEVGHA